mgnify:CR=1 FL=1
MTFQKKIYEGKAKTIFSGPKKVDKRNMITINSRRPGLFMIQLVLVPNKLSIHSGYSH